MIKFSPAQLWVHDQDEALAFYTDKIGMEVGRRQPPRAGRFPLADGCAAGP